MKDRTTHERRQKMAAILGYDPYHPATWPMNFLDRLLRLQDEGKKEEIQKLVKGNDKLVRPKT